MSWKKYFRPVNSVMPAQTGSVGNSSAVSKFSSWLPEYYQGPPNRIMRYLQYDQMDMDHEVAAALDTLADFSTHLSDETGLPFEIQYHEEASPSEAAVLEKSLRHWCNLNEFDRRLFRLFRSTLKYGDQFFIRDPETYKLHWVDPSTVERVLVNESTGKTIEAYYVRDLDLNLKDLTASNVNRRTADGYNSADAVFPSVPYSGQVGGGGYGGQSALGGTGYNQVESFPVDAAHMVHISLTEGMTPSWPFGISILENIFKVYKQKELLEDSILIYRIHRAPERRIFYIDVGTMPPNKAAQYLERVRYEVQQKRIPSRTGGGDNITDAAYNPMSSLEDYYFAQTADGRGSKVDTLPGGENLGQIDDLRYFNNKMLRGLGVPSGYLPTGPEDGSNSYNDGRVGAAFIQEFRFSRVCERYQRLIQPELDREFKLFLRQRGVNVDTGMFDIVFTPPQNFSEYRQLELDQARASLYSNVAGIEQLSKRFALKKYLGLSDSELLENERLWREENSVQHLTQDTTPSADLRAADIRVGGADFDLGDTDFDTDLADADFDADVGDADVADVPDAAPDEPQL